MHRLERLYRAESWADYYVLPDNPPLSTDDVATVDTERYASTVEAAFGCCMNCHPPYKRRLVPVVHGSRTQHVDIVFATTSMEMHASAVWSSAPSRPVAAIFNQQVECSSPLSA